MIVTGALSGIVKLRMRNAILAVVFSRSYATITSLVTWTLVDSAVFSCPIRVTKTPSTILVMSMRDTLCTISIFWALATRTTFSTTWANPCFAVLTSPEGVANTEPELVLGRMGNTSYAVICVRSITSLALRMARRLLVY